jgi:hypothetical protein
MCDESISRVENAMETHWTFFIFMCTTSSRIDFYPQQVSLIGTYLWWENVRIFMWVLEYSHENLSPIWWKPSLCHHSWCNPRKRFFFCPNRVRYGVLTQLLWEWRVCVQLLPLFPRVHWAVLFKRYLFPPHISIDIAIYTWASFNGQILAIFSELITMCMSYLFLV